MGNVVFLIRNIAPNSYGGGESYQIELANTLLKNGFTPIIVTSSQRLLQNASENSICAVSAPYCKKQNWSGWSNLLLPLYMIWQLKLYFWYKNLIIKYHPVAIDIQSRDDWIAATLAGKNTHTKIIWTDHIDFRTWVLKNVNKKGKNFIGKNILKLSKIPHRIIVISDYEKQWLQKNIGFEFNNLTVMKNGVIDKINDYENINPNKQSFCYVGRIVDYKGIRELIEAFNIVSSKYPDAILNIYGDGPDTGKYQKMAHNKRIVFHGYTDEPLKAIAESEIFVLPSYYEGISITLLQAMMLGKEIIVTDIDGNREVIDNHKNGILVPACNSRVLADAMMKILANHDMAQQLAKKAREKYEKKFDFEKIVKDQFIKSLN